MVCQSSLLLFGCWWIQNILYRSWHHKPWIWLSTIVIYCWLAKWLLWQVKNDAIRLWMSCKYHHGEIEILLATYHFNNNRFIIKFDVWKEIIFMSSSSLDLTYIEILPIEYFIFDLINFKSSFSFQISDYIKIDDRCVDLLWNSPPSSRYSHLLIQTNLKILSVQSRCREDFPFFKSLILISAAFRRRK